jgi:AraC-like DNA-binding protein
MGAVKSYSTSDLPQHKQLDAWNEFMSEVYYQLEILPDKDEHVRGELHEASLERIGISRFSADRQRCFRRKAAAHHDKQENFVFLFPTRKSIQFRQLNLSGEVGVDEVVMLNSSESYQTHVPDDARNITIKIPCDLLRPRFRQIDQLYAKPNVANRSLIPAVRQLGNQLLELGDSGVAGLRLQDNLVDMVALMLELGDSPGTSGILSQPQADAVYKQLTRYIQAHYRDPDLSPSSVAAATRISVRYLHKTFSMRGHSFGQALLETRLTEAHRIIATAAARRAARLNVAQVAFACGFNNQSHFTTCYRVRFGYTPTETPAALVPVR